MGLKREHLQPYFLFETKSSEEEGFWPPLYLHNEQTNEQRRYVPTLPDKGWSYEIGLIEETMEAHLDPGEWQRWPDFIEVEGVFRNGAVERQPYRLIPETET